MSRLKADLEAELESTKKRLDEIEPELMQQMTCDGVQRVNAHGRTVYIHRQLWAKPKDGDKNAVCEALRGCGLGQYVSETFNTNSLSAYIRELEQQQQPVPEPLAAVIETSEVFRLRTRAN
jgi:hypothetical protein